MTDNNSRNKLSSDSLQEADRDRAAFSGHGPAAGAAGVSTEGEVIHAELRRTGDTKIIDPREGGYGEIRIAAAWDDIRKEGKGLIGGLVSKLAVKRIDLDLGCLYELQNGERGAIQAFGGMHGTYAGPPYITLTGDKKKGNSFEEGEFILINGEKWNEIKRVLVYVYIYGSTVEWDLIKPQIGIRIPGGEQLLALPALHNSSLPVTAIVGLENVRNGVKITNYTEYFPGHAEMDRAFGFGIQWAEGRK
jgi:tellurite resistance protein TerA